MAYTTNPRIPRLRARAVNMVRGGKSASEVARYFGYTKSAVSKWCKKMPEGGSWIIPTESSRPHHHPKELKPEIVRAIIDTKLKFKRCSEVIRRHLLKQGIRVSLNSVKRKLAGGGLTNERRLLKR